MIVIDTSVFVDYLFEKDEERNEIAVKLIDSTEGLTAFVPRLFLIELTSVSKRLGMNFERDELLELTEEFSLLSEDLIFEEALKIAEKVHSRAIDCYFIATANLTNSILTTNDRLMAKNAKKYGIEAYYLIKELDQAIESIRKL